MYPIGPEGYAVQIPALQPIVVVFGVVIFLGLAKVAWDLWRLQVRQLNVFVTVKWDEKQFAAIVRLLAAAGDQAKISEITEQLRVSEHKLNDAVASDSAQP